MEERLMFHGLYSRIVGITTLVLFIAVVIFEIVLIILIRSFYIENVNAVVKSALEINSKFYNSNLVESNSSAKEFVKDFAHLPYHIQITDAEGKVICDSLNQIENDISSYPDVKAILKGYSYAKFVGKDHLKKTHILANSIPLKNGSRRSGVMRFSVSLENTYGAMDRIIYFFVVLGLIIILLAVIISTIISKTITKPIQHITNISNEMAKGNLSIRAEKHRNDEIGILADSVNHMADEIQKNEMLKNEFISSVSHELRTPLTSIKGWSITIKNTPLDDPEDIYMGIDIIIEESERLSNMVEELLDFSRLTSNKLKLNKAEFDIVGLIKKVLYQLSYKAENKGVIFTQTVLNNPFILFGDKNRLKQVLINVIDNSIKFTPSKGEIATSIEIFEDKIVIRIRDTGIGISEEEIGQIKQKFVKGKNTGDLKGLGLGLAISEEIIKGHHGTLIIKSKENIGTEVLITIPKKS
jgi:signal transduction histidine kinase